MRIPVYRVALIRDRSCPCERVCASKPEAAAAIMRRYLEDADREIFAVLALDHQLVTIGLTTVSMGSLSETVVHPREVFKAAILLNAHSVILAHNHVSGEPEPSLEDHSTTGRLVVAGEYLGIRVHDHLILGEGERFVSMRSRKLLCVPKAEALHRGSEDGWPW